MSLVLRLNVRRFPPTFLSVAFLVAFFLWSILSGVWFDADFSFSEHVKMTCKACFLQMRDLRRIRQYDTPEVPVLDANALVSSRLDYCNSV